MDKITCAINKSASKYADIKKHIIHRLGSIMLADLIKTHGSVL